MKSIILSVAILMALSGGVNYTEDLGVIGIRRNVLTNEIAVVHKDTPAEAAGLKKGDKIVSTEEISGRPGTTVTLVVKRDGKLLTFVIERVGVHTLPKDYKDR